MKEERLEELLVKTTDGVASPAEKEELMRHVVQNPELQRELDAHLALLGALARALHDPPLRKLLEQHAPTSDILSRLRELT